LKQLPGIGTLLMWFGFSCLSQCTGGERERLYSPLADMVDIGLRFFNADRFFLLQLSYE
jgi:hypothetical protein